MKDKLQNLFDVLNERPKQIEKSAFGSQIDLANQQTKDKNIDIALAISGLKNTTIYNVAYKRLIPNSKRRKCLYFDEVELTEWIKKGKRTHTSEDTRLACRFGVVQYPSSCVPFETTNPNQGLLELLSELTIVDNQYKVATEDLDSDFTIE